MQRCNRRHASDDRPERRVVLPSQHQQLHQCPARTETSVEESDFLVNQYRAHDASSDTDGERDTEAFYRPCPHNNEDD